MKRHAKASTAGSTQRQATGLGRILRGAFATREVSNGVSGSGAFSGWGDRSIGNAALALAGLFIVALLLSAAPAAATTATDRPQLFSFDGADTTAGAFSGARAMAVDTSTGSVYVLDRPKEVVDKFNAAGEAASFSALATSSLSGSATPSGAFEFTTFGPDIAVDNSGGANQGRLYIGAEEGPISAFGSAGTYLWQLPANLFDDNCGVAVDKEGHLWVADAGKGEVLEFANTGSPPAQIGSVAVTSGSPCRIALDASGNLYVNRRNGGVDKYIGGVNVSTLDPTPSNGVAVDQTSVSGHIFTLHNSKGFNEYDSSGSLIGTFAEEVAEAPQGIAYNPGLDRVYVTFSATTGFGSQHTGVKAFGPVATGTVPSATIEAPTEVGISKAKLQATVNPQGSPLDYYFQWKTAGFTYWASGDESTPQSLAADSADHAVSSEIDGLSGNSSYEVRAVVVNTENGLRAFSDVTTFKTLQATAPTATLGTPSGVTTTTAQISGTVNPQQDFGTTWRSQLSTDPTCSVGFSDNPGHALGSEASSPVPVAEELTGLLPAQHYCVRLSAFNSGGTGNSEVRQFTTPAIPPGEASPAFAAPRLDTSARINGYVNPEGEVLTYHFEYSKDGGATWIALPEQTNTSQAREQIVVGEELSGLIPNTTYSYRFSAENDAGEAPSQETVKTFTTRSSAEVAAPGRGIELVNNPDKGNQNLFSQVESSSAPSITSDGEKALWWVTAGVPGGTSSSGNTFLAERTATGWVSRNLIPPVEQQFANGDLPYFPEKATPDFTRFVFNAGTTASVSQGRTLLRLDDSQNQEVLETYDGEVKGKFSEITDDGAHVVVISPDTKQLEDIGIGAPELISVMPGGSPSECGLEAEGASFVGGNNNGRGAGNSWNPGYRRTDSDSASRVYFEALPDGECNGLFGLYERNRETADTTLIDPGASGRDSHLIRVTPDGRHAYFATWSKLDPADGNSGADVYRWDEGAGKSSCLTCVVASANIATFGMRPRQMLVSDDFSHVYFQSEEQLVPGHGQAGELNTYALSGGTVRFVGGKGVGPLSAPSSFLSSDGNVLVFRSSISGGAHALTGDRMSNKCVNPFFGPGKTCEQLYRYDDRDGSVECISCRHDGETTVNLGSPSVSGSVSDFRVSGDGNTVAFVTGQVLVPSDVNQGTDVYEWRAGAVRLITDGVRSFAASFAAPAVRGIDQDGSDIFFMVAAPGLTGFEQDGLLNFYDARIGGGFEPPPPPTHCDGESCQGPLQAPPAQASPGSASFSGRGNAKEGRAKPRCAKGKVHRHGRCVRRHADKKRHERASHTNQGRTK